MPQSMAVARSGIHDAYWLISSASPAPANRSIIWSAIRSHWVASSNWSIEASASDSAPARLRCSGPSVNMTDGLWSMRGSSGQSSDTSSQPFQRRVSRANSCESVVTWCSSRYPQTNQAGTSPSSSTGATGPCLRRISSYIVAGSFWYRGPYRGTASARGTTPVMTSPRPLRGAAVPDGSLRKLRS